MRFFNAVFYKNMIWVYSTLTLILGYVLMLNSIPHHIYVDSKEQMNCELGNYLYLKPDNDVKTTWMEVGNDSGNAGGSLEQKDYTMTCYLLNLIPVKDVEVSVVSREKMYASGVMVGIYEKTDGVLVLDTVSIENKESKKVYPAKGIIRKGDYITKINGENVIGKKQLISGVNALASQNKEIVLTINRKGKISDVKIKPVLTSDGKYKMGIWVKDDMAGIGTITYYDKNGEFGALGHGISDESTGDLLEVSKGAVYNMDITGITKGKAGIPGEISGIVYYENQNYLGKLNGNCKLGIKGVLDDKSKMEFTKNNQMYPIGFRQEIKTGKAYILSNMEGKVQSYEIEIEEVYYDSKNTNKCMLISIKDERLKSITGGIVQGMSGSPILQDGRLVGAVTHVLVNDPTKGYGIFIEEMLDAAE